jgi:acetyltransferase
MTIRNLDSLLRPRSVAVIGASPRPDSVGGVVLRNIRAGGFRGPVMPVNPKYQAIDDLPVYPDVGSLPEAPDLAVIATPATTVPGLIATLGDRGTKAAIVISAGFGASEEGRRRTQHMLDGARPHLLRVLGPNCVGLIAPHHALNASFAHLSPPAGNIAFLVQSGAIVTSVIDWAAARRVGFSHLVSMGEMADVDFGDMLDYLASDTESAAILLYMEAVTNARKFMSAARLAARNKPVIVIKAGRHADSARAATSHTGVLAGTDAVYDAAFRRAGLLRVDELDELFAAAATLSAAPRPEGDRLAILTNGGGLGVLAVDALIGQGGRLATLSDETIARLDGALPPTWSRDNPVDIIGDATPERYAVGLEALLSDRNADAVLVLNCPTAITSGLAAAQAVIDTVGGRRRCILTSWVGEATAREARTLFAQHRIPSFGTPEQAVRGFMHLVRYKRNQELLAETPPSIPEDFPTDSAAARAVIRRVLADGRTVLTEPESQAVLRAYGVPLVPTEVAETPAAAAEIATRLNTPVVLKILSPDITHKSDVGGVALDLKEPGEVETAATAMLARVRRHKPGARIEGFVVQPMIRRRNAHELIVGVSEDAQFGPIVLFGQGGTAVEVVADRAIALPPLNLKLARELMAQTRVYRLLKGYRDRPAAALDAIAITLMKVAQLAADVGEVVELDINPLLADEQGVMALDARVRVRPSDRPASARLAIRPYPRELEEVVSGPDGRRLLLRPVRPEDEPAFRRGFAKLSPESIRLRFFAPLRELSHGMAARLTQIDYDREMALVLADPGPAPSAEIYGVVRISADPDGEQAEFAVTVRDDMAGRGLGEMLLRRIIAYARGRGIRLIFGDVLAENAPMLDLCRRLGFALEYHPGDPGLVRASLSLSSGTPA